jgi:hypothetical protein
VGLHRVDAGPVDIEELFMTKDEALRYVLAALEWNLPVIEDYGDKEQLNRQRKAITANKQALEQPVQEPVAWMTINAYGEEDDIWYENPEGHLIEGWTYKPLYTTPPASHEKDCVPCVVVTTSSGVFIQLPEDAARKLADDILRNANYLWPMDEENT